MSLEPYNRLVKIAARALYDATVSDGRRGLPVLVLDALTKYPWAREEDLAKALNLDPKQLGRTLRFLEEEKLVCRYHQKEVIDGPKIAVAASNDGNQQVEEVAEKLKLQTRFYCCLDYAQIHDIIWYRIYKTKKMLKNELDSICPFCGRRNFDALQPVSLNEEYLPCKRCKAASDTLSAEEMGDGDDNAKKQQRDKLMSLLRRMEDQLKPLQQQLDRVKDLPVPKLALHDLDIRALIAARSKGRIPMRFLGEKMCKRDLNGRDSLLSLIQKFPEGLAVVDVKDTYPSAMEDLRALRASGHVWLSSDMDSEEDIVYPNDPNIVINVDEDLKQLLCGITLPRDMVDIEEYLQKNGIKPATNTLQRQAQVQVHCSPRMPKPGKLEEMIPLTNAHHSEVIVALMRYY